MEGGEGDERVGDGALCDALASPQDAIAIVRDEPVIVVGSGSRTRDGPDHGPSAFSVEVRAV